MAWAPSTGRPPFWVQPRWSPGNVITFHVMNRNTDRCVRPFTEQGPADAYCAVLNTKSTRKGGAPARDYGPHKTHRHNQPRRGKRYTNTGVDTIGVGYLWAGSPNEAALLDRLFEHGPVYVNHNRGGWRSNYEPIRTMLKRGYVVRGRTGGDNYIEITEAGRERRLRMKR